MFTVLAEGAEVVGAFCISGCSYGYILLESSPIQMAYVIRNRILRN